MDGVLNSRKLSNYRPGLCSKNIRASDEGHSRRKSDLETLLELGIYHCPLEHRKPDVSNHGLNTIRALADMFTCKLTNFPVVIGIFAPPNKEDYLSNLARELQSLNRLVDPTELKFSALLFIFPFVISIAFGYVSGMLTNWQVGLSVGHAGMFLQIALLAIIITGSRVFHQPSAIQAGRKLATFVRWLHLVLCVCFCYPTRTVDKGAPVKTIVVYHRLFPSSTPNVTLFSLMDKMWIGLIRFYGELPIRLQRASKPPTHPKHRFKRICCIPTVVVVVAFSIAFIVDTGIIRYHAGHLAEMLGQTAVIFPFVLMSSIIFLSVFGTLPSLCRLIKDLSVSPLKPLRTALADFLSEETASEEIDELRGKMRSEYFTKFRGRVNETVVLGNSTSLKNLAINAAEERARAADIKVKEEFAKLCKISLSFDRFLTQHQTKFIICLDASETNQRDVLAKLIYQLHSLILSESSAPVAIVLEAKFKVLLGEMASTTICPPPSGYSLHVTLSHAKSVAQTLSDNLHLVHTSIHLPIYLETPVYLDLECECDQEEGETIRNSIITSPNRYSTNSPKSMGAYSPESGAYFDTSRHTTATKKSRLTCSSNHYTLASKNRDCVDALYNIMETDDAFQKDSHNQFRSNSVTNHLIESCHGISGLFLKDHPLADWNRKVMKQLITATAFSSRLQHLCNLQVPIEELVFWITLVHYWPYHMAWMIIQLEELLNCKCDAQGKQHLKHTMINLHEYLTEVKYRVADSLETLDQLITDDRDLERLERYLLDKPSLSLTNLKKLISCSLMHNPFLRLCIQALVLNPSALNSHNTPSIGNSGSYLRARNSVESNAVSTLNLQSMRAPVHEAKCTSFAHAESMKIQSSDSSFMNPAYSADNLTMNDNQPTADAHEHGDLFRLDLDIQALRVANYSVQDVCKLIASIPTIPLNRVRHYQVNVLKHQIDGKCLLTNEIDTIQRSLKMDPDDWQPFLHLLTYFRDVRDVCPNGLIGSQKRETSGIEPSSAVVSMVVRNKQMEESRTRIGSSSASSTYPIIPQASAGTVDRGKSTAMVRQTPWLLSPVVATGPNNNDVNTERSTDSISPLADSLCTTENQTSLSGMEEPESLWKPTTTAALCSEMSLTNSFHTKINSRRECKLYRSEDAEIFANADAVKEQYEESLRLPTIFQAGTGDFLKMRSYCPTRHGKRTARKRYPKNGHMCSHSTVDLRMILNHNRKPWSHATESTGIRNYSEKGNRPYKESYRRASRNRRVVGLEDELLNFQHTPPWKGLGAPVAYQFKRSPSSANSRLRDHHPVKSVITSAVADDDSTDLRRMRKRLCRRKELTCSDQKQNNLKESFPFPPLLDAEYDYFLPSNVHKMTYGEHQVSKDKSEPQIDLPQSIAHRQLTSLRPHLTSVTRSELGHSLNCLYASPGPNQTTIEASPEALMAASKTQSPPKIPRRNLCEPVVKTTCSNGWIYSSEWSGSRFHPLNSTTSANIEQEFSTRVASKCYIPELCTCNYWYDIEQVMEKTTISEPTLRGYSGESSTDSRHDSNLYTTLHSSADMTESFSEEEHFCIDNERSSSRHSRRSQDRAGDLKRD